MLSLQIPDCLHGFGNYNLTGPNVPVTDSVSPWMILQIDFVGVI